MELLAGRDPQEDRQLLDPVLERMMQAMHRYEGTVNQIMGDGIMALFGAPIVHEDHAVRALDSSLQVDYTAVGSSSSPSGHGVQAMAFLPYSAWRLGYGRCPGR
jgi:class 3 adenylate cyclase